MKLKVVVLQWEDASGRSEWDEGDPMPRPMLADVCGFLLEEKKGFVTVGLERFKGGKWRDTLTIPRPLIRRFAIVERIKVDP